MRMLIDRAALAKMERANKLVALGAQATAEQLKEFTAKQQAINGIPRCMSIADGVAEIRIEGVLSKRPDFWSWYLYGANTTYEAIQQSIALANSDPSIKRVSFYYDTPGGYVDGLFEAVACIEALEKPKSARAAYACSAGYALAAVSGKIEATHEVCEFGSIGVAVTYYVDENVIDITSTEAPNKRPDPTTEDGKAVIVAGLDAIHDHFVAAIVRGRGVTVEEVNADFGRGGVLLSAAAKKAGMIDKIAKPSIKVTHVSTMPEGAAPASVPLAAAVPVATGRAVGPGPVPVAVAEPEAASDQPKTSSDQGQAQSPPPEPKQNASAASGGAAKAKKQMDLKELQEQHPDAYSAALNMGTTAERKRVSDHLKLGAASGDMETAYKAIESGASVSDMTATYLAASMKKGAVADRQAETDAAGAAASGGAPPKAKTQAEQVGDLVEAMMNGEQV